MLLQFHCRGEGVESNDACEFVGPAFLGIGGVGVAATTVIDSTGLTGWRRSELVDCLYLNCWALMTFRARAPTKGGPEGFPRLGFSPQSVESKYLVPVFAGNNQ